jgi:hypothetical protein
MCGPKIGWSSPPASTPASRCRRYEDYVTNTENEVLFLNNLSGFQTLVKTNWDALARGAICAHRGSKRNTTTSATSAFSGS